MKTDKINTNEKAGSPIGESPNPAKAGVTLQDCEILIRANSNGWVTVGRNLDLINSGALYKEGGFSSFEVYSRERWGWSDKHAYRLIDAARCYDVLVSANNEDAWILPRNEAQIRPLIKLGEPSWVEAWKRVLKQFEGRFFTGEMIDAFLHPKSADSKAAGNRDAGIEAKKLKRKLKHIDRLVTGALVRAGEKTMIPAKAYHKLLEEIKQVIAKSI